MADRAISFEHKLLREWRRLKAPPRRVLLAVSGGLDSCVMLEVMWRWRRLLRWELTVAHVHHGLGSSAKVNEFRLNAQEMVRQGSERKGLTYLTNAPETLGLSSESELRDFRLERLKNWREQHRMDAVAFAHHLEDLLETRLIRLIRGTGSRGLASMRMRSAGKFRPLLGVSRAEIRSYAELRGLTWCEDPSNEDRGVALRNWLRHDWLPALEARQPGAVKSMARSLAVIAREGRAPAEASSKPDVGLRRERMKGISRAAKENLVADYLFRSGFQGYTREHVREIIKRLDIEKESHTFKMLGVIFEVTPDLLRASRV